MRKTFLALAVATFVILSGAGLLLWKISSASNRGAGKRAEAKSLGVAPPKLEKLTATGQSRLVAISPDGRYLAYTRGIEKKVGIWIRQLATNTNVEIVPASALIFGLGFANSGEYLYFVSGSNATALYRVPLFGGVPTKIVDKLEGNFSIAPDDSRIAFIRQSINPNGQRQYSLIVAGSDGAGERILLVGTYPDNLDAPIWSPDGASIICAQGYSGGGGQDVRIVAVGVSDGTRKELSPERFFRVTKMAWLPRKNALVMSARKNLGDNNQLWRV